MIQRILVFKAVLTEVSIDLNLFSVSFCLFAFTFLLITFFSFVYPSNVISLVFRC